MNLEKRVETLENIVANLNLITGARVTVDGHDLFSHYRSLRDPATLLQPAAAPRAECGKADCQWAGAAHAPHPWDFPERGTDATD